MADARRGRLLHSLTVVHMGKPAAPLQPFVRGYVQLDVRLSGQAILLPIPARSAPILEFTLGDAHDVLFTEHTRRESRTRATSSARRPTVASSCRCGGTSAPSSSCSSQAGSLPCSRCQPIPSPIATPTEGRSAAPGWTSCGSDWSIGLVCGTGPACRPQPAAKTSGAGCARGRRRSGPGAARPTGESSDCRPGRAVRAERPPVRAPVRVSRRHVAKVVCARRPLRGGSERKKQAPGLRWTDVAHELGTTIRYTWCTTLRSWPVPRRPPSPRSSTYRERCGQPHASRRNASLCTRCSPENTAPS